MSELKVYHCNEWHNEYTEFYMKSEADKVIAELKQKINEAQTELELWRDGSIISETHQKELDEKRHSDYKRCLAIALLCFINGKEKQSVYKLKTFFWSRWGNRWWKLAEKFKDKEAK